MKTLFHLRITQPLILFTIMVSLSVVARADITEAEAQVVANAAMRACVFHSNRRLIPLQTERPFHSNPKGDSD